MSENIEFQRHSGLFLNPLKSKGLGLFCKQDIPKGTNIEVTPLLVFPQGDHGNIDRTHLYNYYFDTSFMKDNSGGGLAMGIMSYCNHADEPNAQIIKNTEPLPYFELIAQQDIPAETEITISYGEVWFDAV